MLLPVSYPYGVRAMWSERSHHRRLGTGPGSLGKVPSSPCVSCEIKVASPVARRLAVAPNTLLRHPIDPYLRVHHRVPVWQIDQTRLKIDAQPDLQSLMCATMTIRLSLTRHGIITTLKH